MSLVELEKAVAGLSDEELAAFRAWFAEYDMRQWDRQIEQDSRTGRLADLMARAVEEDRAGKTSKI
jgi:hypothetical protein